MCWIFGHRWWCGAAPYNGRPWDGIAAVRWCKRCGQVQAHYSHRDKGDWWQVNRS